MISTSCFGNFALCFFCVFLSIFLAPNSLLHYAIKYDSTEEEIQIFLQNLRFPHNLLTINQNRSSFITVGQIVDDLEQLKQIHPLSLLFRRLTTSLWLALCTFATLYRLTLPNQLFVDNVVTVMLISYSFFIAWTFGSSLRHLK